MLRRMKTDGLRPDIAAAAAVLPSTLGSGKEIKKLEEHLWEGESVLALVTGVFAGSNGLLTMTDRRLLFTVDGAMKSVSEDFPFDRVTSVQWSSGMMFGKISIVTSGVKTDIVNVDKTRGKTFVDTARNRVSMPSAPAPAPAPAAAAPATEGIGDQLTKLAALHDAGVLSDEEFAAAKARALGL